MCFVWGLRSCLDIVFSTTGFKSSPGCKASRLQPSYGIEIGINVTKNVYFGAFPLLIGGRRSSTQVANRRELGKKIITLINNSLTLLVCS